MYRFDPTMSSVVEEEAGPPRPAFFPEESAEGPLSGEQLRVRGGDSAGDRLLEGALRGPARDTRLDLEPMSPPKEVI